THVVAIRGDRLKKPIDELAGGRVYTGEQALQLGLVDRIGTMQDAIAFVADQAKVTDYDVRVVPEPKNFLEKLMEDASGANENPHRVGLTLRGSSASLVDLAMPLLQHLDPQRVAAIRTALSRLEMIDREGVILMMSEWRVR
ncbi:MAG: S49 family peptidase, partial [Tepidisphaeraceae bacterium]